MPDLPAALRTYTEHRARTMLDAILEDLNEDRIAPTVARVIGAATRRSADNELAEAIATLFEKVEQP